MKSELFRKGGQWNLQLLDLGMGIAYFFSHFYKTSLQMDHFYNKWILLLWFLVALLLGYVRFRVYLSWKASIR